MNHSILDQLETMEAILADTAVLQWYNNQVKNREKHDPLYGDQHLMKIT